MLEVFNNLYMSIAEQMGAVLENTAASVTIKERLDFSCAVFDAAGDLIANAPHMPVHLGSMGASVKAIIAQNPDMGPGDVYVLNAPYNGGTHLPDITVVRPVWDEAGAEVLFYTAARGHHTDVGGLTPGSMPPDSRTIHDEGAYIDNWKLVDAGRFREAETRALLLGGAVPGALAGDQPRRPEGAARGLREGGAGAPPDGRAVRARGGARLHAPCAGQRRGVRAAGDRGAAGRRVRLRDGSGLRWAAARDPGQDQRRPGGAVGGGGLHGHDGGARDQLQCAGAGDAGGGALRVPLPRRRRHPDERGGDDAARGDPAGRDDALASLPRGGDRGQRRDQPGGDIGAVPGARACRRRRSRR